MKVPVTFAFQFRNTKQKYNPDFVKLLSSFAKNRLPDAAQIFFK